MFRRGKSVTRRNMKKQDWWARREFRHARKHWVKGKHPRPYKRPVIGSPIE